jgi:hypothetical protein
LPELQLPDLHNVEAGVYVIAVMFFPTGRHDDHQHFVDAVRNQAVANNLRQNPGANPIDQTAIGLLRDAAKGPHFAEFAAGFGPAALTRGYLDRPMMAGMLLTVILAYAEHDPARASKEAAYAMLGCALTKAKIPGGSRLTLMKIFDDFEPVIHLWTAAKLQPELWQNRANGGRELAEFLGCAESLRMAAEKVRLDRGLLLDPIKSWKVPSRFTLPQWEIRLPTPDMLKESMKLWQTLSGCI